MTGYVGPDKELELDGVRRSVQSFLGTEVFLLQLVQGIEVDKCMQRTTLSALTQLNRKTEITFKSQNMMGIMFTISEIVLLVLTDSGTV